MKRRSEIMYTASSEKTEFLMHPDFGFDKTLPRLVDYTVSDSSDSDESDDLRSQFDKSIDNLKSSLEALGTPVPCLDSCLRRKVLKKSMSRNLKERVSLRLKAEKEAEKLRNDRLINMMQAEDIMNTSAVAYDCDRPSKRIRLETSVFRRFSPRRMSFLRKSKKRSSLLELDSKKSIFAFLRK